MASPSVCFLCGLAGVCVHAADAAAKSRPRLVRASLRLTEVHLEPAEHLLDASEALFTVDEPRGRYVHVLFDDACGRRTRRYALAAICSSCSSASMAAAGANATWRAVSAKASGRHRARVEPRARYAVLAGTRAQNDRRTFSLAKGCHAPKGNAHSVAGAARSRRVDERRGKRRGARSTRVGRWGGTSTRQGGSLAVCVPMQLAGTEFAVRWRASRLAASGPLCPASPRRCTYDAPSARAHSPSAARQNARESHRCAHGGRAQ